MDPDSSKKSKSQDKILKDHKKVGKRFIPPLKWQLSITETRWIDYLLPEIVWLGLLHYKYGLKEGVSLAVEFAKITGECCQSEKKQLFAGLSAYESLSDQEKTTIMSKLNGTEKGVLIKQGLVWLIAFYPECPLRFLFGDDLPNQSCYMDQLPIFKEFLTTQFNRREKSAMFTQSTAVYIGLVTDVIHVQAKDSLANIQAMVDYPKTEESRLVGANVRACITGILGTMINTKPTTWSRYFWNQGLKIEPCNVKSLWREYGLH